MVSDAHERLKSVMATVLTGAAWQRCGVHVMRNVLAHVPKGDKSMVAAAIRTIFAQHSQEAARQQLVEVVSVMEARWRKAADVLAGGEDDVLIYMTFPPEHWTRIYSTNPLERVNREVKRRTNVVGIFPDADALLRLVGSVLIEAHEEWQAGSPILQSGIDAEAVRAGRGALDAAQSIAAGSDPLIETRELALLTGSGGLHMCAP